MILVYYETDMLGTFFFLAYVLNFAHVVKILLINKQL